MTASTTLAFAPVFNPSVGRLALVGLVVLVIGRVLAESLGLTRTRAPAWTYLVTLAVFVIILSATWRIDSFCSTHHDPYARSFWGTCDH